jgi:hypothetical protein
MKRETPILFSSHLLLISWELGASLEIISVDPMTLELC